MNAWLLAMDRLTTALGTQAQTVVSCLHKLAITPCNNLRTFCLFIGNVLYICAIVLMLKYIVSFYNFCLLTTSQRFVFPICLVSIVLAQFITWNISSF